METSRSVQSVQRSFELLEALHRYPDGATHKQLCEALDLPKSTVHRLLQSLQDLGYAVQNSITGKYRASYKMFEVGSSLVEQIDIVEIARPHLNQLAHRLGETIHLVVQDGCDVVYVFKSEGGDMRMSSRLGLRIPLYCSAVGKAILATLPDREIADIFAASAPAPRTERTITRLPELMRDLAAVRERGWALDDEENELGIRCVGAALPKCGNVRSAFSISGMRAVIEEERILLLAQELLAVRQSICRELGL